MTKRPESLSAMILAAGRGERMRPLTDHTPKPLLHAGSAPLIEHTVRALAAGGYRHLVINHAHLGAQIPGALGDGRRFGVTIEYSDEGDTGLETGGGIYRALPLLRSDPFVVVNGDIWTDFGFAGLPPQLPGLAHLVLIDNPPHHPGGDFCLERGLVRECAGARLTFSGIGVYRRALFAGCVDGKFPLGPLLRAAMPGGAVSGEHFHGSWMDIGTPDRLEQLDTYLRSTGQ